ncbi:MAG: exopolyphosphatase [Bacteroidota bacterium]
MNDKLAVIDIGTNTFRLLICTNNRPEPEVVFRMTQPVRIGHGGISEGRIAEDAIRRMVDTLSDFRKHIDLHQVPLSYVFATGTSAIRNAKNSQEVLKVVKEKTGITIKVISGDEEAELIYYGIKQAIPMGEDEPSLIMDIGGGSVEFIIAHATQIFWKKSFEIGGQRMMDKFYQHDPILDIEVSALEQYLSEALEPLRIALDEFKPDTLIGSSGTFDTLSDIFCIKNNLITDNSFKEKPLTKEGFFQIHRQFLTKNREQRLAIPGMIEMRVDMIVVASCLLNFLMSLYPFRSIRVSNYSLKEGLLYYHLSSM